MKLGTIQNLLSVRTPGLLVHNQLNKSNLVVNFINGLHCTVSAMLCCM